MWRDQYLSNALKTRWLEARMQVGVGMYCDPPEKERSREENRVHDVAMDFAGNLHAMIITSKEGNNFTL